jgi:hypothetical protein
MHIVGSATVLPGAKSKPIFHLVFGPSTCSRAAHFSQGSLPPNTHIFLAYDSALPSENEFHMFWPEKFLMHATFCEGFGPLDILSITKFVRELDAVIFRKEVDDSRKIVCCAGPNRRSITNTVFLIGAYLIMKLGLKSSHTSYCFRGIDPSAFLPFRNYNCHSSTDFDLSITDCWQALERAKGCGWISLPHHTEPYRWGLIDIDAYAYYNDPVNADLHAIIPGRLIALRAPKDLGGRSYVDM